MVMFKVCYLGYDFILASETHFVRFIRGNFSVVEGDNCFRKVLFK